MDAAILTKCIAPIGAAGSSGATDSRPAAPRSVRAPSWQPSRAWGAAQSAQEDTASRATAEPLGEAVAARREVFSDEESVREMHPKRR
eukprot:3078634-Pleurochrysis_carterae.AAC.1